MQYLIFLLLFFSITSYAALYQSQDNQGNTTYSDQPLPGSTEVTQPNAATITRTNTTTATPIKPVNTANTSVTYKTFAFITPQDQGTIQNQPDITVKLSIEPALQAGDKVQLMLDGKPWGNPEASASINMHLVERGVHTLAAVLLDKNQKTIKETATITIYVHRASALFNPSGKQI